MAMEKLRRLSLVAGLCLALLGATSPVGADDFDASDPPRTSGPLVGSPFGCDDNGPAKPHETRGQACSWAYDLVPAQTNATEDFSAYWVQIEVDPGKHWCVKEVSFKVTAPNHVRIVSAVPARGHRIARAKGMTSRLVVDAEGTAPVPGVVSQGLSTTPGRTTVDVGHRRYSYRWRGNSADKLGVAIGLQLAGQRLSPELFRVWSEGIGFIVGTCSTHVVRSLRN